MSIVKSAFTAIVIVFLAGCGINVDAGTVVDKEYTLILEDEQGNKDEVFVTKEEYNSVKVGDQFDSEE